MSTADIRPFQKHGFITKIVPSVIIMTRKPTIKISAVEINDNIPHKQKTRKRIERLKKILPSRVAN